MDYKIETKKGATESETKYLTWVRQSRGKGIILLVESTKKPYVLNDSLIVENIERGNVSLNFSLFYGDEVIFEKE